MQVQRNTPRAPTAAVAHIIVECVEHGIHKSIVASIILVQCNSSQSNALWSTLPLVLHSVVKYSTAFYKSVGAPWLLLKWNDVV